jgi:hypothetical protein
LIVAFVLTAYAAISGAGLGAASTGSTGPSLKPSDPWNTFSADITIRRKRLAADGSSLGAAPAVTYRWEQRLPASGSWKSTMTLTQQDRPNVQSLLVTTQAVQDALAVARVEDDGNGSPLRLFDRSGQPIQALTPETTDRLTQLVTTPETHAIDPRASSARPSWRGKEWVHAIVAEPSRAASRRATLDRRYGKVIGSVNGLDRRLLRTTEGAIEVLADRTAAVTREINTSKSSQLASHVSIAYQPGVANALVRRLTHRERLVPSGSGIRAVTDVELANVRLENRSGQ